MTSHQRSGDELLIRRTARGLAVRAAVLVGAAMLLLIVLVTAVVVRGQQRAADASLRTTAATADDVGDPPSSSWLLIDSGSQVSASGGLPGDLGEALTALRAHPTVRPVLATLADSDGDDFRVVTQLRKDQVVQVVLDLQPLHQDRDRLLTTMTAAAVAALLVAGGLGALLGRRAVRPLAHALALQRTFVADASHELRTPLTLLSTRVQVLNQQLRAAAHDPQVLQDSRGVVEDVQRLAEVVEDLLVAADPRGLEQHQPIDVRELLQAIAISAAPHASSVGVTLTAAAPEQDSPLTAPGSAPALRRAILALVDNAIDHTPAGGQVHVQGDRQRGQVVIAVSDTGPGLPQAASRDVLRRFHSGGHRAGRQHYGPGLALSNDVANRHGGQLRLAPSLQGTTFELVLPAVVPRASRRRPRTQPAG